MTPQQVLTKEKSGYGRVEPPCRYFGVCGGCALQDLSYTDQLTLKRQRIQQAFAPLGAVPSIELVGLEEPWRYRNKAEFTFGESDGRLTLGYHAARSFWRIVDLDDCLLLPEPAMRAVRTVLELAAATGLRAYHPRTHQGVFRYVVVRTSLATGQVLVCLITRPGVREVVEALARALVQRLPTLTSVYWGATDRMADVAVPDTLTLLHGAEHLEERVGALRVAVHPMSFLQPTGAQARRIYELVRRLAHSAARRVAWDLYCGLGLVGLHLAPAFQTVYGIDIEPNSLTLAARNAQANDIRNIVFRRGKVEVLLADRRFWLQEAKPDVVVVDPPRAGLHPSALASLLAARPTHLIYISCNVQTLVRDLQGLCSGFPRYRLTDVQAFDMFPQTNHAEVVTLLERA